MIGIAYPWCGVGEGVMPPKPPVIGLDMEDDEHHRQIGLLLAQILNPIRELQEMWEVI